MSGINEHANDAKFTFELSEFEACLILTALTNYGKHMRSNLDKLPADSSDPRIRMMVARESVVMGLDALDAVCHRLLDDTRKNQITRGAY